MGGVPQESQQRHHPSQEGGIVNIKKLIADIKLSLTSKRAILADLEEASTDARNLQRLLETEQKRSKRAEHERDLYFNNWRGEQRKHAEALNEIQSLRSRVVGTRGPVIPAAAG